MSGDNQEQKYNNQQSLSMDNECLVMRGMEPRDVDQCLTIFRDHGLPETAYGLHSYLTLEPEGCHVVVHRETQQVIAMCVGTRFDPRSSFIGFYGVRPGFQGKGIGIRVWNRVMSYLKNKAGTRDDDGVGDDDDDHDDNVNIGLFSSPDQISTYKQKAGFVVEDVISMTLYESHGVDTCSPSSSSTFCSHGVDVDVDDDVSMLNGVKLLTLHPVVPDSTLVPEQQKLLLLSQVIQFDQRLMNGVDRSRLLSLTLCEPETVTLVAIDSTTHQVIGYGSMKTTNYRDGRPLLAPLYADRYDVAVAIVKGLTDRSPGSKRNGFFSFGLHPNPDAERLAALFGLEAHLRAPRLFTRSAIGGVDVNKIYAIISPDVTPY